MSVINSDGKRRTRRPSLKGALMQDISNGQERTRSWPKARGKKLSPKTLEQMEWFRTVQLATKYMAPDQLINAMNATAGTPLLPRDILTMMAAGRLYYFLLPDGRKIASRPMINDVSQSLDVISDIPGTLLKRGADQWEPFTLSERTIAPIILRRTTNQTGGGVNVYTSVIWDNEVYDPLNMWSAANPTRITAPMNGTIIAISNGTASFGPFAQVVLAAAINGNVDWRNRMPKATSGGDVAVNISAIYRMNAGDYIETKIASDVAAQDWVSLFTAALFIADE